MPESIAIPQTEDFPISRVEYPDFLYRYAYARSQDSRESGDPGQDFLSIRASDNLVVFALCDGVSQSFMGDIAARIIGQALLSWFAKQNAATANPTNVKTELEALLNSISTAAQLQLDTYIIPEDAPAMLRDVLIEKRQAGSESMFCAGILDIAAQKAILAWMGDIRLRIWGDYGERTAEFGETFDKKDRWSTRLGLVGELHATTIPLNSIHRMLIYTDGLSQVDAEMNVIADDRTLTRYIKEANGRDDIALLDILLELPEQLVYSPLLPPESSLEIDGDDVKIAWPEIMSATQYQVTISWMLKNPAWTFPISSLLEQPSSVQVRAWDGEKPGEWGRYDSASIQSMVQRRALQELAVKEVDDPEIGIDRMVDNKRSIPSALILSAMLFIFAIGIVGGSFLSDYTNKAMAKIPSITIPETPQSIPSVAPTLNLTSVSGSYPETPSNAISPEQYTNETTPLPNVVITDTIIIPTPSITLQSPALQPTNPIVSTPAINVSSTTQSESHSMLTATLVPAHPNNPIIPPLPNGTASDRVFTPGLIWAEKTGHEGETPEE